MKPELTQDEVKLLVISASELCEMLENRPELDHVRQNAYEYLTSNGVLQVQVTVTRRESDFLDAFQTEEMKDYSK